MAKKKKQQVASRGRQNRVHERQVLENLRHETTAQQPQQSAADFARRYRRWMIRRYTGIGLAAVGAVMILVHVLMHLANVTAFPYQDLLVGYPTGGILVLGGIILASQQ